MQIDYYLFFEVKKNIYSVGTNLHCLKLTIVSSKVHEQTIDVKPTTVVSLYIKKKKKKCKACQSMYYWMDWYKNKTYPTSPPPIWASSGDEFCEIKNEPLF